MPKAHASSAGLDGTSAAVKSCTMLRLARIVALVTTCIGAFTDALRAQAQVAPPQFNPPTNVIPPTVTAAMGDVGGKFF